MRTATEKLLFLFFFATNIIKADWINIEESTDKSLNPKILLIGHIHQLPEISKKLESRQSLVDNLNLNVKEEVLFTKKK
jgi:hypothetical protein